MGVARRWLTHRSRIPPVVRVVAAALLGAYALMSFAAASSSGRPGPLASIGGPPTSAPAAPNKGPEPPGPGDPTKSFPSSPALVAEGQDLYQNTCASCHGPSLQGERGVAPSLTAVGPGPVDFYLSTGRMPLQAPRDQPTRARSAFNRSQI